MKSYRNKLSVFTFFTLLLLGCSDPNSANRAGVLEEGMAPLLAVYKQPSCGCCDSWVSHVESNGFRAMTHVVNDLSAFKSEKGIAPQFQSCHTAISSGGYVFEGHIPANVMHRFMLDKPEGTLGLAVPGMPVGSPGMEMEERFMPYDVLLLKKDGSSEVYAHISAQQEQYQ